MTMHLIGVYRDGVFHPVEPVEIAENTTVTMAVDIVETKAAANIESDAVERERRGFHELLVAANLGRSGSAPEPFKSPLSPEREAEIGRELAKIGPIYNIIREERDSN
jgi:hypothetical protein